MVEGGIERGKKRKEMCRVNKKKAGGINCGLKRIFSSGVLYGYRTWERNCRLVPLRFRGARRLPPSRKFLRGVVEGRGPSGAVS